MCYRKELALEHGSIDRDVVELVELRLVRVFLQDPKVGNLARFDAAQGVSWSRGIVDCSVIAYYFKRFDRHRHAG